MNCPACTAVNNCAVVAFAGLFGSVDAVLSVRKLVHAAADAANDTAPASINDFRIAIPPVG